MTSTQPLDVTDAEMNHQLEMEIDPEIEGYIHTQKLILAASNLDLQTLRDILDEDGANVQDPETLVTPLHAAILAVVREDEDGEAENESNEGDGEADHEKKEPEKKIEIDESKIPAAKEAIQLLLENKAVWDCIDANDETPGCLARRLGLTEIYQMIVDAGVRAELVLRLAGYFMLGSDDEDEEEEEEEAEEAEEAENCNDGEKANTDNGEGNLTDETTDPLSNDGYLSKPLPSTLPSGDLVDEDSNAVMMSWETPLMEEHAASLLPSPGKRILNIGHGMGIFDGIVRDKHFPSAHHIIEAHPTVVERMEKAGWKTGRTKYPESSPGPSEVDVVIHSGKWQTEVPKLVEAIKAGELSPFDAVYYDTFAESYDDFRDFAGHVPDLLGGPGANADARFGFFSGAGADRQVCYDVYNQITEMDMRKIGFYVDWKDLPVKDLEAEGVWKDVARPYWNIEVYRMPTCSWLQDANHESSQ